MGLVDGKVAVVTGGGRGIGRAHALALAAEGASVLVNDVGLELRGGEGGQGLEPGSPRPDVAKQVVEEIVAAGGRAVADSTNVGDIEAAASVVTHAIDEFGDIDILVNNAGTWNEATIFDLDNARFDAEFATHVKGTMGTTRAAVTAMRDAGHGGRIINTVSGFGGGGGMAIYLAAKSAVASFTLTTSKEGAPYGITANAISPMAITRQSQAFYFRSGLVNSDDQKTIEHLGPGNNSPLVVFLASDLASHITGKMIRCYPDGHTADSWLRLSEQYFNVAEGIAAPSWSVDEIAAALPLILR
jgi:NAD(P)-dependent dehydrogenase (short-subunit alcohol dehydrogenase family)